MNSTTTGPIQLPHIWSREALLTKAQRYAEQMLQHPRDEWTFVFWSTLVLELVARAALANVSPAMLADAREDWSHLYFALGHAPTKKKFVPHSIDTREVITRLQHVNPSFTPELAGIAAVHIDRRNEELHTGGTPMDSLGTSSWLPGFYQVLTVLLSSMGESLDVFVGDDEANFATSLIAAASDESAKAVGKNVSAHQTLWTEKSSEEQDQARVQATAWATKHQGHRTKCPACDSDAILTGSGIAAPLKRLEGDTVVETQQFLPARFECIACGLRITGFSQLAAAKLGDAFTATYEYDAAEYYAPEDRYGGYEPDFNEPD